MTRLVYSVYSWSPDGLVLEQKARDVLALALVPQRLQDVDDLRLAHLTRQGEHEGAL